MVGTFVPTIYYLIGAFAPPFFVDELDICANHKKSRTLPLAKNTSGQLKTTFRKNQ